jgi:hypothetical protein
MLFPSAASMMEIPAQGEPNMSAITNHASTSSSAATTSSMLFPSAAAMMEGEGFTNQEASAAVVGSSVYLLNSNSGAVAQ